MTIINMPYSEKGRDEHDRVFGKKKTPEDKPTNICFYEKPPCGYWEGSGACTMPDEYFPCPHNRKGLKKIDDQKKITPDRLLPDKKYMGNYILDKVCDYAMLFGYKDSKKLLNKIIAVVDEANKPAPKGIIQAHRKKGGRGG